jgi:DNA-3-methyladenine glycosylase I
MKTRCEWGTGIPLLTDYHDKEWGVPEHDDRKLFELLILEGAQAGLNWMTVLNKREGYRQAFNNFDIARIAEYDEEKVAELIANPAIIRNRLKVRAAIQNARAFLAIQQEFGTFDTYIWRFVDGKPKKNAWKSLKEIPARTPESDALSKDLISRFPLQSAMLNDETRLILPEEALSWE